MTLLNKPRPTVAQPNRPRINREMATVSAMIEIYCRNHHTPGIDPCDQCRKLETYATQRLLNCRFQEDKPTCGNCPVHCYKSSMRQVIIEVMRYSGPRMVIHHPYLALRHLLDGRRSVKKLAHPDSNKSLHKGDSKS